MQYYDVSYTSGANRSEKRAIITVFVPGVLYRINTEVVLGNKHTHTPASPPTLSSEVQQSLSFTPEAVHRGARSVSVKRPLGEVNAN